MMDKIGKSSRQSEMKIKSQESKNKNEDSAKKMAVNSDRNNESSLEK